MTTKRQINIKKLTTVAMLSAMAVVLQYLEVPIPLVPSFIKLDFSDLPEIIGAFICGPAAGVLIAFLKNIIHLAVSQSGFVGELSNFVLGASFALTAGLIYKKKQSFSGALIAGVAASVVMGAVSLPLNNFIIYPLYYSIMGYPKEAILQMYQAIRPSTKSIFEALVVFNIPFTIIKGLISAAVTLAIYKPVRAAADKILESPRKQAAGGK
ncbi:MAG: ECF transporter S component [Clostridiales bacterium]|nr:ECF transporter S component [Clostridiales bacterium]